jgi:hypothetical protein
MAFHEKDLPVVLSACHSVEGAGMRKKLTAAISSVALLLMNDWLGLGIDPATAQNVVYVVITYLLGQGIADAGKEKPAEA